ncbi:regulator of G protein signaling domain [Naegleria gruberi]|uniref:Regulator of G protein signaling domain n=1 Tax=Naegleria gruberi TaxID=5762 RepID=D2VZW2_NAEGR|nr:regulator of G protein signaling domain [Naegleria gruberi]EFC37640.1 regulator of G protein signaling domain [Naegleria gruberi]|eukprot:XP_002670384.1 regulator of G protein signaling domain [Naegleria gruberi strain NEG-M]
MTSIVAGTLTYLGFTQAVSWFGFTKAGIAAGSCAAAWMSSTAIASGGGVAAGSAVSTMQAAAATGAIGGPVGVAVGVTVAGLFFVAIFCLRIIIGRKQFPCSLYSWCFFVTGPVICLPTICRCLKLYFMYKFNLQKTKLYGHLDEQSNVDEKELPSTIRMPHQELFHSSISTTSSSPKSATPVDTPLDTPTSLQSSTSTNEVVFIDAKESISNREIEIPMKELRKMKFFQFMGSHSFVILVYLGVFVFQTILWAIVGGIDEIVYTINKKTDPSAKRALIPAGFFESGYGCIMTSSILGIILTEAIIYIAMEVFTLILCIRSDRDTWNIKKESLIYVVIQSIGMGAFIVAGFIPIVGSLIDYYVPYLLFMCTALSLETVVCVLLPVCYELNQELKIAWNNLKSVSVEESKKEVISGAELVLKNRKTFNILLDFARRSYCPEPVLCWQDIQRYKSPQQVKNRKEIAKFIIDNYISLNSPLELNMASIEKARSDLMIEIEKCGDENLPSTLFDGLELHCIQDLSDVMHRLTQANSDISRFLRENQN